MDSELPLATLKDTEFCCFFTDSVVFFLNISTLNISQTLPPKPMNQKNL